MIQTTTLRALSIAPLFAMAAIALAPMIACGSRASSPAPDPLANPSASPMRASYAGYTVVWLRGTPYEMGYQHGQLLHDELAEGVVDLEDDPVLATMAGLAQAYGLVDLARTNSYPDFLEECRGMVDAAGDVGWTMDDCLVLNFGDALTEFIGAEVSAPSGQVKLQPGCAQIVATDAATKDGAMLHARIMDWENIDFVVKHPTVFVRQPADGVAHVVIGFPGNVSPYQGMNAAGVTVGTNQIHSLDVMQSRYGRSNVQLAGEVLAHATSLEQARDIIDLTPHLTHLTMVVSDARANAASVFEIAPTVTGERPLDHGVVFATNHFVSTATKGLDTQPPAEHSILRFERLGQLVPPAAAQTKYGAFDPTSMVALLRDRVNPETQVASLADVFDDGQSLATDGALYEAVFDPSRLRFWVAAGAIPIPQQPFVGFSLASLLGQPGGASAASIP